MASNCRFAFAVHTLCVLAYREGEWLTSEALAQTVNTNAVVIRRLLLDLREAGLVETQRGPGGGARLAHPAACISLAQVHQAVAGPIHIFGEHPNEPAQSCPVGRGIKGVLEELSQRAAQAVEREYQALSLADVLALQPSEAALHAARSKAEPSPLSSSAKNR